MTFFSIFSIILLVPPSGDKVLIQHHPLPGGKHHIAVKTGNRLGTPPLVIDSPGIPCVDDNLPPRGPNRKRQVAGRSFFYFNRLRSVYRPAGIKV